MTIVEKLEQLANIINSIGEEDPGLADILLNGFTIAFNTARAVSEQKEMGKVDISDHINLVCKALNIDLEEIVMYIIQNNDGVENTKQADEQTLNFITSDLDDYEKFLAQNSAKQNLEFLAKEI